MSKDNGLLQNIEQKIRKLVSNVSMKCQKETNRIIDFINTQREKRQQRGPKGSTTGKGTYTHTQTH